MSNDSITSWITSNPLYTTMDNFTVASTPPMITALEIFAAGFLKPSTIVSIVVAASGIIFNVMNIIVLCHPKMRSPVNFLLSMMAIFELLLLILHIPYVSMFNLNIIDGIPRFHTSNIHHARFRLFYINASLFLHMSATWLLIVTACFRFIYVQFPIRSAKLCSYRRAVIASVCTIGACFILTIPNIILYKIIPFHCSLYRGNVSCSLGEYLYSVQIESNTVLSVFNFWLFAIVSKFIIALLLLIFTAFLIKVLFEADQRKKRLQTDVARKKAGQSGNGEHQQTVRMLLAVVALFLLIEFPHGILIIYVAVCKNSVIYDSLGEVIDLATITAFSLNIVLYSTMSRQYRSLFIEIFSRKVSTKFQFKAKYMKCRTDGLSKHSPQSTAVTCALTHNPDISNSVLHHDQSQDEEEKSLMTIKPNSYTNA
ncbi:dmsr-8 [Bugula neritina]|uniref:Dmsr-8 n=1 Tax=Bugula neritina TaxID=10212 RepID=A0A7J7J2R1_BUGNE|nr:dmsr-8 [Bugula neritina]